MITTYLHGVLLISRTGVLTVTPNIPLHSFGCSFYFVFVTVFPGREFAVCAVSSAARKPFLSAAPLLLLLPLRFHLNSLFRRLFVSQVRGRDLSYREPCAGFLATSSTFHRLNNSRTKAECICFVFYEGLRTVVNPLLHLSALPCQLGTREGNLLLHTDSSPSVSAPLTSQYFVPAHLYCPPGTVNGQPDHLYHIANRVCELFCLPWENYC